MTRLQFRDVLGTWDRSHGGANRVEEDNTEICRVRRLVNLIPWESKRTKFGGAVQELYEWWLAGWKNDQDTLRELDNLCEMTNPDSGVLVTNRTRPLSPLELDAQLFKEFVGSAVAASGGQESSYAGRQLGIQAVLAKKRSSSNQK